MIGTQIYERAHMGILTNDMMRVVNEQQLGFIATVCPDGTPNLFPKGTTAVWDDEHLVFADICSPVDLRCPTGVVAKHLGGTADHSAR